MQAQLLVLAKEPLPGRAKTRLSPALSPAGAADVARACLADTLAAVAAVDVLRAHRRARRRRRPPGCRPAPPSCRSATGDLGDRLAGAFADARAPCSTCRRCSSAWTLRR